MSANEEAKVRKFKIQIDKEMFETSEASLTGRQLLALAGKSPAEQFAIYEKVKGGQPKRIGLDQSVDLSVPGVEKFLTLPLDQTEGER